MASQSACRGARRWQLACAVVLVGLFTRCTERTRLNPLDPENPWTGGRPTGLEVVSVLDSIRLSWQPIPVRDLTGYRLYRKLEGESDFTLRHELGPAASSCEDRSAGFGVLHTYRVTARVGELESPPSPEVSVTPGPTIAWVADAYDNLVLQLTHDVRHALSRTYVFCDPFRLEVDTRRGTVWFLDEVRGCLGRREREGTLARTDLRLYATIGMALDTTTGNVWIADSTQQVLQCFDHQGRLLLSLEALPKLSALAFHAAVGELWGVAATGSELVRVSRAGTAVQRVPVPGGWTGIARALAVHPTTDLAWVAAGDRVVQVEGGGRVVLAADYSFRLATRVAADPLTNGCWVIDDTRELGAGRVLKLDAAGRVQFVRGGFSRPQALAVNPYDGSCYVADTLAGRMVRITAAGEVTPVYTGMVTPTDIDIVLLAP